MGSIGHDKFKKFLVEMAQNTHTSTAKLQEIPVRMDLLLFEQFAKGLEADLQRRNWKLFDNSNISVEDLFKYLALPLVYRISDFEGVPKNETNSFKYYGDLPRHQVNNLNYPFWIEHVVAQVGIAVDYDYGLKFVPQLLLTEEVNLHLDRDKIIAIHHLLGAYEEYGLALVTNVLPKGTEGNIDVMAMTIIEDIVKSYKHLHPAGSYVAAFLGNKIAQQKEWSSLFRVSYEEVEYIRTQFQISSHLYGGDQRD